MSLTYDSQKATASSIKLKYVVVGAGVISVLALGIAWMSGAFSGTDVQPGDQQDLPNLLPKPVEPPKSEQLKPKNDRQQTNLPESTPITLVSIEKSDDLDSVFLQLAADPKKVMKLKVETTRLNSQWSSEQFKLMYNMETVDMMCAAIEKNALNPEALKGAAVLCNSLKLSSKENDFYDYFFWESMEQFATVCRLHSELRIAEPLKLLKSNRFFEPFIYLDAQSVLKIKPSIDIVSFVKAVAKYEESARLHLEENNYIRKEIKESLDKLRVYASSFFRSENEKKYPKYTEAYAQFTRQFKTEMGAKISSEYFLPPDSIFPFDRLDYGISAYFSSELTDIEKEKVFDAYLYTCLIETMHTDVVECAYDAKIIEKYKKLRFSSQVIDSQMNYIQSISPLLHGPDCDENGKWKRDGMKIHDLIISSVAITEVTNIFEAFCAQNKGKSTINVRDEFAAKIVKIRNEIASIGDAVLSSYAAKIFNKAH